VIFEDLNLGSYRGRLEIIADILHVVSQNPKKTQIMYRANLSYKVLTRYLTEVSEASLINFEDEKQCYRLTTKGREFLEVYKEYSKGNRHIEKRLNEINGKKKILEELCSSA
jgi:predicted transcriptional regulator